MAASNAAASVLARNALRVAMLREDFVAQFWLRLELEGVRTMEESAARRRPLQARLIALVGEAEARRAWTEALEAAISRRTIKRKADAVMGHSAVDLELFADSLQVMLDNIVDQESSPMALRGPQQHGEKDVSELAMQVLEIRSILERLRNAAHTYVLEAEVDTLSGVVPSVVAKGRAFAEGELAKRAPDALAALDMAETNVAIGGVEAGSMAATCCRRAIKALADALYPPGTSVTDDKGVTREMDDKHYRNRLTQFVLDSRGRSHYADLVTSNLTVLGMRLKSLDDLASKGVHAELASEEAEACVAGTWALATELLRIDEQAS